MSYFDNYEKDNLLYDMEAFLENHKISDLLEIVQAAIETEEYRRERK